MSEEQQSLTGRSMTLLAFTLAVGIEQWTGTGMNVVLTDLGGSLGAVADEASWALTLYSSAFAVSVLLTHRLSNLLGNRRLLSFAAALYAFTSLGCACSPNLASFLFFRVLEGFAGGVFLARTLVFTSLAFSVKERVPALGIFRRRLFLYRSLSVACCERMACRLP